MPYAPNTLLTGAKDHHPYILTLNCLDTTSGRPSEAPKQVGAKDLNCNSPPDTRDKENPDPCVLNVDYYLGTEQELQYDIQVEVGSTDPESPSITAGM